MAMETQPGPRAEVANTRRLNQAIREAIRKRVEKFPHEGDEDYEWSFLCECGCLSWVRRTSATFDLEGAWLEGHKPN